MPDISIIWGLPLVNWIAYATYLAIFLVIVNFNIFATPLRLIAALAVMGYCLVGGIVYYNMGSPMNLFLYWGIGGAISCFLTSPYWLGMIGLSMIGGCWFFAGCIVGGFFFGPILWLILVLRILFVAFSNRWLTGVIGGIGVIAIGIMGRQQTSNTVINLITNPQLVLDQHITVDKTEEIHVHRSENTVNVLIEVEVVKEGDVLVTRKISGLILQGMSGIVVSEPDGLMQPYYLVRLTTNKGIELLVKARNTSMRPLKVGEQIRVNDIDRANKVVLITAA